MNITKKEKMVFELRGVEFNNKGAELMLKAIVEEVKLQFPDAVFVMELSRIVPRKKLLANNIYTKTNIRRKKINFEPLLNSIPKFLKENFKLIAEKEVDVILDGSGFAYGDQWGFAKAKRRLGSPIKRWKAQNKKIILLPQAFGPFKEVALAETMKEIVQKCDLIFARDKISYDYLTALLSSKEKIKLRPDFTNLLTGKAPVSFNPAENEVAIIPNTKMVETNAKGDDGSYINLLKNIIEVIKQLGYKPFFLMHEGAKDIALAEKINASLKEPLPVIKEEDSVAVKGIIGKSKAVITSRFHGLVSALSQGIPCLATGWSHKYEMLLNDYEYPEGLINIDISFENLKNKVAQLLNDDSGKLIRERLTTCSVTQKKLSKEMWQEVFDEIKSKAF